MYSIILVEDDFLERDILKRILLLTYEGIKIYEADSESTALFIIENNDINMFLIDINLKDSSGLDLAISIRNIEKYEFRPIVFLTTHVEYITQAFKQTHCYDFILKPYNKNDVCTMLNKLILNEKKFLSNKNNNEDEEIVISLKSNIYIGIKIKDIFFIEVKGKDCEVNTLNGSYIANKMSLIKIMKLINCEDIIQSHRAFAINRNCIGKIEKLDSKLSIIYFNKYPKTALLGYKFKDIIISEFTKHKVIIC